jgi:tetratricopeptide (TPR) repeat protein/transcriptional regulator with XRE-family HTH domain
VTDAAALGASLRARRERAGLSQGDLAARAGLSIRALREIEAGRTEYPHPGSIQRLADALALEGSPRADFLALAARRGAADVIRPQAQAPAPVTRPVVPHQLPPSVPQFAGRDRELRVLAGIRSKGATGPRIVVISAMDGSAGIGTTALAVQFGHQAAQSFPDGQLYVNLAGFGPARPPVTPGQAMRGFLESLGVRPDQVPAHLEDQAGLYRSLLAARRMLVVLDNAADEEQVRPLLPGSPGCLAVVTSRRSLAGLAGQPGAALMTLDYLPETDARHLLAGRLGEERLAADPQATGELVTLCAGMPLALAIAAARAAARPRSALAGLAAELHASLDALGAGEAAASVRAAFSWSYQQLKPAAARMFRLLGLHPGPDISVAAAGSLAGTGEAVARRLLSELARVNLLTEHVPGRYTLHDLLRAYAAERPQARDDATEWEAATGRMLDHYLHSAAAAGPLLVPAREPVLLAPPRPGTTPEQPAGRQQALAWFEDEHQVLLAAVALAGNSGFDAHAWQLPWAMASFLQLSVRWQDWAATQRTALAAAGRLGDTAAEAVAARLMASACMHLGDHDQARRYYASSLRLYQRLGNRLGEANIQHNLGMLAELDGRYAAALGHAEQALSLSQAVGNKPFESYALNNVGWYLALLGDYVQAREYCRRALALAAETGDRRLEGQVWDSLGHAEHQLGNLAEAVACYQRALSLYPEGGDRFGYADTLSRLGDTHLAIGDRDLARQAWQQALAILDDLQHPDAGKVRDKLRGSGD